MKNFLIGFFGMFFGVTITIATGVGSTMVAHYFIEDRTLSAICGIIVVLSVIVGLLCTLDDDTAKAKEGMLYKVQIGGETFYCKDITHEEDTDTVVIKMDGIASRVSLDTDIIISKI